MSREIRIFLPEVCALGTLDVIPYCRRCVTTDLYESRTSRYRITSGLDGVFQMYHIQSEPGAIVKDYLEIRTLPAISPKVIIGKEMVATGELRLGQFRFAHIAKDSPLRMLEGVSYGMEKLTLDDRTLISVEIEPESDRISAELVETFLRINRTPFYQVTTEGLFDVVTAGQYPTWVVQ